MTNRHTFYTIAQAATAIAALLCPDDASGRPDIEGRYRRALLAAMHAGKLVGQSRSDYLPIDPASPIAVVAFVVSVVRLNELNRWLADNGIPIQVDESARRGSRDPQRDNETQEKRRARLSARRDELKAAGVRNFNQVLANEECVTISRIQQILRGAANGAASPSPFPATRQVRIR
ncbi:hypothetical protein [Paraburkholderia sediminicola]|uniref:hypothetical protein n=1 Tax=Paraburkholderia sediminicola TaxID=458836 RepID=UPI0038B8E8C3